MVAKKLIVAAVALVMSLATAAAAAELGKPKGDVILTISGAITNTNGDGTASFDLGMLMALPVTTFSTRTTWTEGVNSFTGVSLHALLAATQATGSNLHAIALNDYAVDIPTDDAVPDGPIVAYLMDGKPMPVRDKGPLWIIYPFDSKPDYRTEATYSKSIWQLSRINVK